MKRQKPVDNSSGDKRVRKARTLQEENRTFQANWEHDYFFVHYNNKAICLICRDSVANFKGCNLSRHYDTRHPDHSKDFPLAGELRRVKLLELKKQT